MPGQAGFRGWRPPWPLRPLRARAGAPVGETACCIVDRLKVIYCHGFASGPLSSKGRSVRDHLGRRGVPVDLLDLRVDSPDRPRLSRMIDVVRAALDGHPRALAIGSSLGGLAVARAAQRDGRIAAAILLAPAFLLAERWRARMGEVEWDRWKRDGSYRYADHTTPGAWLDVDFGFMEDAARFDAGFPDVRVPVTVVHGRLDETVDPGLSRRFAAGRPDVRLIEVEDDHQLLGSLGVIRAEVDSALDALAA